jgi:hypothetical protein
MKREFEDYIKYVSSDEFYKAHESLELLWRNETNIYLRNILRGLINGAVGLEIKRRAKGNPTKPWEAFMKIENTFASADIQIAFETTKAKGLELGLI